MRNLDNSALLLPRVVCRKAPVPGQKHEDRRAKVRDPAREEDQDVRPGEVRGLEIHHITMNEFARVIEEHNDHYDPAQQVNGIYAPWR